MGGLILLGIAGFVSSSGFIAIVFGIRCLDRTERVRSR